MRAPALLLLAALIGCSGGSSSTSGGSGAASSSSAGASGSAGGTASGSSASSSSSGSSSASSGSSSTSSSSGSSSSGSSGGSSGGLPPAIGRYAIDACVPGFNGGCRDTSLSLATDGASVFAALIPFSGDAIVRFDLATGALSPLAPSGNYATDLAWADGRLFAIRNDFSLGGGLTAIDPDGGSHALYDGPAFNVEVGGDRIYWSGGLPDGGAALFSAAFDGGGAALIATPSSYPTGFAVDAVGVYWGDGLDNSVHRAFLDGGGEVRLVTGPMLPGVVAVDATSIYWADHLDDTVARAPLDGGAPEVLATGMPFVRALAPRPDGIYVEFNGVGGMLGDAGLPDGTLSRIEWDGGVTVLVTGFECPEVGAVHLAFTDAGVFFPSSLDIAHALP